MGTIDVCITIDTEFSIGGAFADPSTRRPIGEERVTCPVGEGEGGLGFLIGDLGEFNIKATFFVETLNVNYFGDTPMGRLVERILTAGHDAQLHLHPCWLYFERPDWQSRLRHERPNDCCDGRSIEELGAIIAGGIKTFAGWGAPMPIALRTGSLRVDRNVYIAMSRNGVGIGSNIGVGIFNPAEESLRILGGRRWLDDVLEVPVLTYTEARLGDWHSRRLLTITSTSWREMEWLLWQARRHNISPVVVLTHPFEFVKGSWDPPIRLSPNRINRGRFRKLCRFLAENTDDFSACTFTSGAPRWLAQRDLQCPEISVPLPFAAARMITNRCNDLLPYV